jgi:hypothetical protein
MLRNWKLFGVTTLVVCALAAPPRACAQQDGPPPDDPYAKLEKQLKTFKAEVIKAFADALEHNKELKNDLVAARLRLDIALDKVALLENQLKLMQRELDALKATATISKYPNLDGKDPLAELKAEVAQLRQVIARFGPNPQVTAQAGEMMFVNRYPEDVTLEVNGANQGVIPANTSRYLKGLPPGPITYEIISPTFGRTGVRRTTLVPGEPLRVNIN